MKTFAFAMRNIREIIRDRLNVFFGIGFPIVLLFLLTAIQSNIPNELYPLNDLAPGIAVFGLSFISLFSGMLIARDRTSSFMFRLFASPMTASDFIAAYTLPFIPLAIVQIIVCFIAALILGLEVSVNILLTIAVLIPATALYTGIGLLCGSILTDRQVGGICGALLTNLSAWLSGTWFELDLVGGIFEKIAGALPFYHAVEAARAALNGELSLIPSHLFVVVVYAAAILILAVIAFTGKMYGDKN